MQVLEVNDLWKFYGSYPAVRGLTFAIDEGIVYSLVGPNGAGKTTTLRTVVGLLSPSRGSVKVMGYDVHRERTKALKYVTYVPDNPVLYGELTVMEYVYLLASIRGLEKSLAERRAEYYFERFELKGLEKVKVSKLSRGNIQKLILTMAFIPQPKLIVMDEPYMALDVLAQKVLKEEIKELVKSGSSVLLSSHVLPWVEGIADRVCIMHRGIKVIEGTITEVKQAMKVSTLEDALLKVITGE
ncbi:MAG: ABC transporter ATP-binding protein [Thermoprotei archaeon]|nr:MAG: ABC transporter ATP-binding protein [Thermoprotei archaeon]